MQHRGARLLGLAAAFVAFLFLSPLAQAGFVTGLGPSRTVHLADSSNGLVVTAAVPEVFENSKGATYVFDFAGSNATAASAYTAEITASPADPDTRVSWNATVSIVAGAATTSIGVTIAPYSINGTQANAPFRVSLLGANGTSLDNADLSIDLLYRTPPPDGGLLQLAIASVFFWGLVFLYALHLQKAQAKLRARADALERALEAQAEEGRGHGTKR